MKRFQFPCLEFHGHPSVYLQIPGLQPKNFWAQTKNNKNVFSDTFRGRNKKQIIKVVPLLFLWRYSHNFHDRKTKKEKFWSATTKTTAAILWKKTVHCCQSRKYYKIMVFDKCRIQRLNLLFFDNFFCNRNRKTNYSELTLLIIKCNIHKIMLPDGKHHVKKPIKICQKSYVVKISITSCLCRLFACHFQHNKKATTKL